MDIESYIWKGNIAEPGDFISDGIFMFKSSAVVNKQLAKQLHSLDIKSQRKTQEQCQKVWDKQNEKATKLLSYIGYCHSKDRKILLFIDDETTLIELDERYFHLAIKLLSFDNIKAQATTVRDSKDAVILCRSRQSVGLLMPMFSSMDLPEDLTVKAWPDY